MRSRLSIRISWLCWYVAFASLPIVAPRVAQAEDMLPGTFPTMDPRAVGLAGALRASPSGTTGIYLNPAVIPMVPIYHIEAMYQYVGDEQQHSGGLAIVDSVTSFIGAGLSFNYSRIDHERTSHEAYDGRLAVAGGIADVFYIGATGRYLHLDQNIPSSDWGPAGRPALPSSGSQQVDGFTFDAGAAVRLGNLVTIGVAGYNLTNTESIFAPIQLGTGISVYLLEMLLLEADAVVDFTSHEDVNTEIRFGTELFLARTVALRVGYIYDVYYDVHSISAGLGYVHPKFGVDFGFMHDVLEEGRMVIAFSFKYFVN